MLNGVVEKATGNLLRVGRCDFTTDGSFDEVLEEQHPNPPRPYYCVRDPRNPDSEKITNWDGVEWTEVDRPPPV